MYAARQNARKGGNVPAKEIAANVLVLVLHLPKGRESAFLKRQYSDIWRSTQKNS
jgi:hypothetical protein